MKKSIEYSVVTMWYNEEKLAPFFLKNYSDAHKIVIIFDSATNDRSREIAKSFSNVEERKIDFHDGFDDQLKIETLMNAAKDIETDWVLVVDCDEFVFAPDQSPITNYLVRCKGDIVFVRMWNVYRHFDDKDLDPEVSIINQRRNGDIQRNSGENRLYSKPIIFRPSAKIELSVGAHFFRAHSDIRISNIDFY